MLLPPLSVLPRTIWKEARTDFGQIPPLSGLQVSGQFQSTGSRLGLKIDLEASEQTADAGFPDLQEHKPLCYIT